MKNNRKGSVLGVVILASLLAGLIIIALVSTVNTQRHLNLDKELQLQSNSAAENALDYTYSYLINEINKNGLELATSIPASGNKAFALPSDLEAFINGAVIAPKDYSGSTGYTEYKDLEVRVGAPPASYRRVFIDGKDPANTADPNVNQWIYEKQVPVVAKVTATKSGRSYTAYMQKNISVREIPLFQYSIFFQGQLQLHRGYRPVGDIHANGSLLINAHNSDTAVYNGVLSSSAHIYRGTTIDLGGSGGDPYGYTAVTVDGDLDFESNSPKVKPDATGTNGQIKIYAETDATGDKFVTLEGDFDSRMKDWTTKAIETFKGHLIDKSHEVPVLTPTGSSNYQQDVSSTTDVNEFSNGPYGLIEPVLSVGHPARKSGYFNNLENRASLILRVEFDASTDAKPVVDDSGAVITDPLNNLATAANPTNRFIVRAYKKRSTWSSTNLDDLDRVTLPKKVFGVADSTDTTLSSVQPAQPYLEQYAGVFSKNGSGKVTSAKITAALHDPRLGRGVNLLTIDMAELKRVMEADPATLNGDDLTFRNEFDVATEWNATSNGVSHEGVLYIEFPTSLTVDTAVKNTTKVAGADHVSYKFKEGSVELRHPSRWAETDNEGRPDRTDKIVPIAPELRRYPTGADASFKDEVLTKAKYTIPAVQIINGSKLPNINAKGFTIATNAPLYLVGNYNSDGDYTTGTNITSTSPTAYAVTDTNWGEIPAAIFCDTLTVLSNEWYKNRINSFYGDSGDASKRPVSNYVEISACIATGEYPIFEFFTHTIESYKTLYDAMGSTQANPIIFKGSVVGMFLSEIQHIKQAYGRNKSKDIQVYWADHGAYGIPATRYHQMLMDGIFPPGTPVAYTFSQVDFRLLRLGRADDVATLTGVGFPLSN